jgi:hypothetical protein
MFPVRRLGLGDATAQQPAAQYLESSMLVLDVSLTALQNKANNSLLIDPTGDFELYGLAGSSTGTYQIRVKLPSGRYMPDSYGQNLNLVGSAQFPVPLTVPAYFLANSRIYVDLIDTSNANNAIELVFIGIRHLPTR